MLTLAIARLAAAAVAVAGVAWTPSLAADAVGVRAMTVTAPERQQALTVALWYPAGDGGTAELIGENKVFEGVPARRDAEIADGVFPIVLLSHGGLRAAPNQSGWIASRLADLGFIVAVVQPPRLADARAAVAETWLRPADLSAALTALSADPGTAGHAAPGQVAAVGFFLGGTSGLALAGARLDAESYARSCDPPATGPDCTWFAHGGVDLRAVDAEKLTRSQRDPRVGTIVAIDPELTASLSPESLSEISARVAIINLGPPSPGLDASGLQGAIPGATYAAVPDATQFSAMAACTPQGAEILLEEGEDDAICSEAGPARERTHARLAEMIADAIGRGPDRP
jgi:predicted dienelactone hydrolase